jgi:hypothetical protein
MHAGLGLRWKQGGQSGLRLNYPDVVGFCFYNGLQTQTSLNAALESSWTFCGGICAPLFGLTTMTLK